MSEHTCHALGCARRCPPEHLMCSRCWATVPKRLQTPVWNAYTPGQCDGQAGIRPEWHEAADKAIAAAAIRSGRFTPAQARAWLGRHDKPLISEDTPASRIELITALEVLTGRDVATKGDALRAVDELAAAARRLRSELAAW